MRWLPTELPLLPHSNVNKCQRLPELVLGGRAIISSLGTLRALDGKEVGV